MKNPLQKAILKTLAYADIFDYPLKEKEIWQRLIGSRVKGLACLPARQGFRELHDEFSHLSYIKNEGKYYFLSGRQKLVGIRQKRKRWSQKKWVKARQATQLLKFIPTVKMVAVTGNLAVENCERDDDIDLLIVASPGTLWLTRLLATLLLEITGQRRRPGEKNVQDKICLNMFLEENYLQIPKREQDLYTAHEVAQLKPLWERGRVYQNFLVDNLWIENYLPNAINVETKNSRPRRTKQDGISQLLFKPLEGICRWLQLWYMKKRRTSEVIASGLIRFHPHDARKWILASYQRRIQNFPLDKQSPFDVYISSHFPEVIVF